MQERRGKMLNLEPETAALISVLIRTGGRTRLLEIGSSNGYITLWLAYGARATGRRVTSIERDPDKHSMADENLRRAGLRDVVNLQLGDATEVIGALPGPFDLVFFDADRISVPVLLSHPGEISGYLAALEALPRFDRLIVPVGKGLSVAYREDPTSDAPG